MRSLGIVCAVLALCLILLPVAGAQTAPPGAGDSSRDAGELYKEQGGAIDGLVAEMGEVLKYVLGKLEKARNPPDVVLINCLNEKLTAIKGLLRISEQAKANFFTFGSGQDYEKTEHEYAKVEIARQKITQLKTEADGCAGEAGKYTGETMVEVEVDEEIEDSDEGEDDTETTDDTTTDRPQCVSPYKPACKED